jgi:hypothetical protein
VNKSVPANVLEGGDCADAVDVRFTEGGVSSDYNYLNFDTAYAGSDKPIMQIAPYELDIGTKFLMRLRPTGWDRWNGANWLTLSGALTGTQSDRLYSSIQSQLFVVANGIDKLKSWDGNDATAIADLSADAPVAFYITRIGTRLLAARIKVAGILKPNFVAWSADGNILDWSTALSGAGSTDLLAEGSGRKANYITGLSTVARGAVIYRQQAIQMGLLTGQGAAPFRFTTVDFSHGTESPYSIANGGIETGDFFLGSDYMPYIFNGEAQPIPIGGPIHSELLKVLPALKEVVGVIDTNDQEYWIGSPAISGGPIVTAWGFSIREWALKKRFAWRRRTLPPNTWGLGFGQKVSVSDPIVDTVGSIVDTVGARVDSFALGSGPDRLMFGDTVGQVRYIDKGTMYPNGSWLSRQMSHPQGHELTIDRTRLKYLSDNGGTVAISVTFDGGVTFSPEKVVTMQQTSLGTLNVTTDHRVSGRKFQIRLRPLTGFNTVSEIEVTYQDLGMTNG